MHEMLIVLGAWLIVYSLTYLFRWLHLRRFYKLLPVETPEAIQQFWDLAQQRQAAWRKTMALLIGVGTGVLIAMLDYRIEKEWVWRLSGALMMALLTGELLIVIWAGLPLDRLLRQTSWSRGTQLVSIIGFRLFWYWPIISMAATAEISRQLAPNILFLNHGRSINILFMASVFLVLKSVFIRLGLWIAGAQPAKDATLSGIVQELCQAAKVSVPKTYLIPDRGGKMPLGAVVGRRLLISEYLRQELTMDELRAILAHEVAHIAGGDIGRRRAIVLGSALAGILLLNVLPVDLFEFYTKQFSLMLLALPLLPVIFLPAFFLRGFQREELKADKLGAMLIGDRALMAEALMKIHNLGYLPANFPKEKKMTHPSLANRLNYLNQTNEAKESIAGREPGLTIAAEE
jgi:Zn-dependent protease with chaperone function